MLSGIGPADQLARTASPAWPTCPASAQNLIDHPEVPMIATAQRAARLLSAGRRLAHAAQRPAVQAVRHRPDHFGGRRGRRLRQPDRPGAPSRPSRRSACRSSISTATRSALVEDTYGVTITTVVVKPKSRGFVRLRSADPDDMPLVSPNLLKHPDDMRDDDRRASASSCAPSRRARSPSGSSAIGDPGPERSQRRGAWRPIAAAS